jgi:hypothetical protein
MELPSGEPRKGPRTYFLSSHYQNIGDVGNCAGFTAVSLVRYLNLLEGVELDVLRPENRAISPLYAMPNPGNAPFVVGESDIADYIHLYQARQFSQQFSEWWRAHENDTPQEVFQSIAQYTQNNEPVAVSIRQVDSGHRMTAYRTEQSGNTGYIYVYDNNWPGDDTRRIAMDLTTGRWSYDLAPGSTWTDIGNISYSPGSLNFPASLPGWGLNLRLQESDSGGTQLGIDGDATLLITDEQGNKLGFENGSIISEIPDASYMPIYEFNPDVPDAQGNVIFFIPDGNNYDISIEPTATGSYTLTAFADNSALSLNNISITNGTTDKVTLADGVHATTIEAASDTDYCHYVTLEVSDTASRDYTSCVTGDGAAAFDLNAADGALQVGNTSNQAITVDMSVDQVGTDSHADSVVQTIDPGNRLTFSRDTNGDWNATASSVSLYLPFIAR